MAALRKNKCPRAKPSYAYLVSACLAGIHCTYNGSAKLKRRIRKMARDGTALPVCPEIMGGSSVPRRTCEILGGDGGDVLAGRARVVTPEGRDITPVLVRGARDSLKLARAFGIRKAILKSRSPSCGAGLIYDGTFRRRLVKGDGVTAALLRRNKIRVYTEKDRAYA